MFSIYNGLLYNEFFAIPNDWFGSCFETSTRYSRNEDCDGVPCDLVYLPKNCEQPNPGSLSCWNDCVYPFGVDPAWYLSPQLLNFTNNMKMKISVIVGVWHMTMGVCVKGFNAVHFKQPLTLIFEAVTGVIIMLGLVGWMDFLIMAKWTFPMQAYSNDPIEVEKIKLAPSIITVMINNILAQGQPGSNYPAGNPFIFVPNQIFISELLLVLAFVSVPMMLCCKPCIGLCTHSNHPAEAEEFDNIEPVENEDDQQLLNQQKDGDESNQDIRTYEELLN